MSKTIKFIIVGLAVAFLSLGSNLAFAKEHGGHAKEHGGKEHGGTVPSGWQKGEKKGWKGAGKPPGWSKGKKKAWQGAGEPSGLAKKEGSASSEGK